MLQTPKLEHEIGHGLEPIERCSALPEGGIRSSLVTIAHDPGFPEASPLCRSGAGVHGCSV